MKRILAASLLTFLSFNLFIEPCFAILDNNSHKNNKKAKKEILKGQTILEYINFDWWKKQNDPYLEKYISTALEKNNDIKLSTLKLEQSRLNVMATRANQLPTLSLGASPAINKMPYTTKTQGTFALPIIAQYELDIFGKNWDKTKSAKKSYESAQYQTQSADIAIVSMVATVYYNIVKLDKIIELQELLTTDRKQIYDMMKTSNLEGITSTQDLILAEKNYVLAQNDLLDYQKTRQNALNSLAVLIGDSPNNTENYERIEIENISNVMIPAEISSDIILNRPDYKAIEKQLEASGIDVRVAKKEFLPTFDIIGLLTFLATSSVGSMSYKNSLTLLGANATLPIFTGLSRVANLKLNKNRYEQLLEQYQKTGLTSIQEVNDSLYNLKSDNEKWENNKKALAIQEQDFLLTKNKYNQGIISKLDLLQQREALIYMQILEAQSKMDCHIDKISLYKSTGAKV